MLNTAPAPSRRIVYRTTGQQHGPITRFVSPGELGHRLKPFVFLDLFKVDASAPTRFGLHPHSGIATLTVLLSGEIHFSRRDGTPASLHQGGMEWMLAGGGVWHGGPLSSPAQAAGFQLWVALPPAIEDAPSEEIFLTRDQIPVVGPVRVLLGNYQGAHNVVAAPSAMTYLHVVLEAGERWTFDPPADQPLAWIALDRGEVQVQGSQVQGSDTQADTLVSAGELVIFEDGATPLEFRAAAACSFVLGSAAKHPHTLVMGSYSVHTNPRSLAQAEMRIIELRNDLQRMGRLNPVAGG